MADIAVILHFSLEAMSAWSLQSLCQWHERACTRISMRPGYE